MELVMIANEFEALSFDDIMSIDGGISLMAYEILVLSIALPVGAVTAIVNPAVGMGVLLTGFGMCMEAEEYGRSQG